MHAHDFFIDACTDRQGIEGIAERLPKLDIVTPLAVIIKTIDAGNTGTLVVATQSEEVLGVLVFVTEEEGDNLQAALAAIDIITKKQVIRLRWESTVFEKTKEIMVLSMDVATDLEWCLQLYQRGL
jgi:hypothetical protein